MVETAGWSAHRFISFDETPILYRKLGAAGTPRGAFLVVHGMGEHSGRYREFAEHLVSQGFVCYLPDLRGFGESGGERGCLRRFTDHFQDLAVVERLVRNAHPSLPVFVFGHSFGGLLVSHWIAGCAIDVRGLVLSSPNFGIAIRVPRWRHHLALLLSRLWPDFTQDNRVDSTKLTHDTSLLAASASDSRIHHRISARLYAELVQRIDEAPGVAATLRCPALVLQAGEDHIVSRQATEAFFARLGSADKELEVYEGLYHEILNEPRRPQIFARISEWAKKRL